MVVRLLVLFQVDPWSESAQSFSRGFVSPRRRQVIALRSFIGNDERTKDGVKCLLLGSVMCVHA